MVTYRNAMSRVEDIDDQEKGRDPPHQSSGRAVVEEDGVVSRENAPFEGMFFGRCLVSDPGVPDRIPFDQQGRYKVEECPAGK